MQGNDKIRQLSIIQADHEASVLLTVYDLADGGTLKTTRLIEHHHCHRLTGQRIGF